MLQDWHSVLGDRDWAQNIHTERERPDLVPMPRVRGKKTSNTFREFIVYDNLQAFPAYIIYYAREF